MAASTRGGAKAPKVRAAAETSSPRPSSPRPRKETPAVHPATAAPGERIATVHEAKTHLSRLLAEVEAGGTLVITRRGKPIVRMESVQRRPRFGSLKGLVGFDESFFDPLPDDELAAWEGQ